MHEKRKLNQNVILLGLKITYCITDAINAEKMLQVSK